MISTETAINSRSRELNSTITLAQLSVGEPAIIKSIEDDNSNKNLIQRMMEMGLTVGTTVSIAHLAPFGGAIAVNCRGSLVALRIEDTNCIRVEKLK